ncbi:hypothetical protein ABZ832_20405 [Streptantibioticus parmotrematis]|uniref:hypothetical protein n=1 Tax=Streptantibioticus parmotrematis TaxID=2873249 RepID=UPI0033D44B20
MRKRSLIRRLGESAWGLLLLTRVVVVAALAVLVLAAGAWVSWSSGRDAVASGLERGTMTVTACGASSCSGPFAPSGPQPPLARVSVDRLVTRGTGQRFPVVVEPGTAKVVRTGPAGVLFALRPLAGALLLTALVVGFGLRMRRTAWLSGLAGVLLVAVPFALG